MHALLRYNCCLLYPLSPREAFGLFYLFIVSLSFIDLSKHLSNYPFFRYHLIVFYRTISYMISIRYQIQAMYLRGCEETYLDLCSLVITHPLVLVISFFLLPNQPAASRPLYVLTARYSKQYFKYTWYLVYFYFMIRSSILLGISSNVPGTRYQVPVQVWLAGLCCVFRIQDRLAWYKSLHSCMYIAEKLIFIIFFRTGTL